MNGLYICCGCLALYDIIFCCQVCFVSIRDDWCGYRQTYWFRRVNNYITHNMGEEMEERRYENEHG